MNENMLTYLCRSFYLKNHPVLLEKQIYKENYCRVLTYFVTKYCHGDDTFAFVMLEHYYHFLLGEGYSVCNVNSHSESDINDVMKKTMSLKFKLFKLVSYRFVFVIDCLFLCSFFDKEKAKVIFYDLKSFFKPRFHKKLNFLFSVLYQGASLKKEMNDIAKLVHFWKIEKEFFERPLKTILVTATMSAGKSTLINALVGKKLMRASQGACTGHICHLYNKPFEDGELAVNSSQLIFNADMDSLIAAENSGDCQIASNYHTFVKMSHRICIIDTPGVNSAINRNHGEITKQALQNCSYDKLIYVLNANQLGTNDEISYLKYISLTVPKEKVIFVLNKVDTFKKGEDAIEESICKIKNDLIQLGYENPVIFPVSAYFSLLIKLKLTGFQLNKDEEDEFLLYCKKYNKSEYDLTHYYTVSNDKVNNDVLTQMSQKSGLYGLETILLEE